MASKKTVIVTGASQGIGAAVVQAFLGRGYNVVATSRSVSKAGFAPSPNLALGDRDAREVEDPLREPVVHQHRALRITARREHRHAHHDLDPGLLGDQTEDRARLHHLGPERASDE